MLGEGTNVDLKLTFDSSAPAAMVELIKDLVAMANSGGGSIKYGYNETEKRGVSKELINVLDGAKVSDKVNSYVTPAKVSVSHQVEELADGNVGITLSIAPVGKYPLVFSKDGHVHGRADPVFRKGDIYVRHGAKSEKATYEDLVGFIDTAIGTVRGNLLTQLQGLINSVVRLPEDFQIQFVPPTGEQIAEPNALLATAVARWKQHPATLLDSRDLLWCLRSLGTLNLDEEKLNLLLRSALRRNATLFFWLKAALPYPAVVQEVLMSTLNDQDRDKSDAARSLVEVGALTLGDDCLQALLRGLETSRYEHFKRQAEKWHSRQAAIRSFKHRLRSATWKGQTLLKLSTEKLESLATGAIDLMLQGNNSKALSRALGNVGRLLYARVAGISIQTDDGDHEAV